MRTERDRLHRRSSQQDKRSWEEGSSFLRSESAAAPLLFKPVIPIHNNIWLEERTFHKNDDSCTDVYCLREREKRQNCVSIDVHQQQPLPQQRAASLKSLNVCLQETLGSRSEEDVREKQRRNDEDRSMLRIDLKEMILQRVSSFPLVSDAHTRPEAVPFLKENRTQSAEAS